MHRTLKTLSGFAAAGAVCAAMAAHAEILPVRTYTTADGLLRDSVSCIVQDPHGFIWFCTSEGLSRFDGYGFANYTTADGLPHRRVNSLVITRTGMYWIATEAGLVRFNPAGQRPLQAANRSANSAVRPSSLPLNAASKDERTAMFTTYRRDDPPRATSFTTLLEDDDGTIWCGTATGLFRLRDHSEPLRLEPVALSGAAGRRRVITALTTDGTGALWVGTNGGLFRMERDSLAVEAYTRAHGLPATNISSLARDKDGRIWAGMRETGGVSMLVRDPARGQWTVARTFTVQEGLQADWVMSLKATDDGRLWIGTRRGVAVVSTPGGGAAPSLQTYSARNGLCEREIWRIEEDRDANMWIGSSCGVERILRYGFTGYTTADGLGGDAINSIFESRTGALFVTTNDVGRRTIDRFEGKRFTSVRPILPARFGQDGGWGWKQTILEDRTGQWWVPAAAGLFRAPGTGGIEQLAKGELRRVSTGAVASEVFRVYEDSRSDLWIATTGDTFELLRWDRASATWYDYTQAAGMKASIATAFREDAAGNLWIATSGNVAGDEATLIRYRAGRLRVFTREDGVPQRWIRDLHLDGSGRLWIATSENGLVRLDDPAEERPRFVAYTMADGLSSNDVWSITEDRSGRIYAGTARALDQLDPATGAVRHFTTADGLPADAIVVSYRDRHGALWFGSPFGLARFVPEPERKRQAPITLITGFRVSGTARPISSLGATSLSPLALSSAERHVIVEYLGLGGTLGETLQYEYRLSVGSESEWTRTSERTITFANLAPGAYTFEVRAVNADGMPGATPASASFTIPRPVWQRWWFLVLVAALGSALLYAAYRRRLERLLELERVRTRIASDLHDDIGANLTRIAILSEIAHRRLEDRAGEVAQPLSTIARISRESVSAMSDIVWAINPRKDQLGDLTLRMRQLAAETFASGDIRFQFRPDESIAAARLGADLRRTLFLIFKEALNNAVRHAGCRSVDVSLTLEGAQIVLSVRDDGRGFAAEAVEAGHGLASMRARAAALGGTLHVAPAEGGGTRVTARLPRRGR